MIKSLTGFGNVDINDESKQLNIILRSVNSRFLHIKLRGIDLNPKLELEIRKAIQTSLQRGSVQVQIYVKNGSKNGAIKFDKTRYEQIENILDDIHKVYGRHIDMSKLISISDLVVGAETHELSKSTILNGVKKAITQVDKMRIDEGKTISVDIKKRIDIIQKSLKTLEKQSEKFVEQQQKKYKDKINSMLVDIKIDENRLAQEIAINVDRYDFTEEIVRSLSHCEQLVKYLDVDEPVGKKLNFILQEISREINTVGSKSPSSDVSQSVVELKSEIEKIREQVQNIL